MGALSRDYGISLPAFIRGYYISDKKPQQPKNYKLTQPLLSSFAQEEMVSTYHLRQKSAN